MHTAIPLRSFAFFAFFADRLLNLESSLAPTPSQIGCAQ
jgi:hypothetical protein